MGGPIIEADKYRYSALSTEGVLVVLCKTIFYATLFDMSLSFSSTVYSVVGFSYLSMMNRSFFVGVRISICFVNGLEGCWKGLMVLGSGLGFGGAYYLNLLRLDIQ